MPAAYLDRYKIAFIHIPKCAGTSVNKWLEQFQIPERISAHPTLESLKRTREIDFSFTIVRNPWDRLVSFYHFTKNIRDPQGILIQHGITNQMLQDMFYQCNGYSVWPSFDQWLRDLHNFKKPEIMKDFPTPMTQQHQWVNGLDVVLRVENLEHDFRQIQEKFNCSTPLPLENTSTHTSYQDYYTAETKDLVANWFADDIKLLGYEF
jgi:hypothetical protein